MSQLVCFTKWKIEMNMMNRYKHSCVLCCASLLLCCFAAKAHSQTSPLVLAVDFEKSNEGVYQASEVAADWPNLSWQNLADRAGIIDSHEAEFNKVLKIFYPQGSVGPSQGGGQFLQAIVPAKELWLSYQVKFAENFDFRLGGKLPGLTSGGAKYSGGTIPKLGQGWSARYMWRKNGEAIIYLYHMKMPGSWGEDLALEGARFKPGQWHTLVQHIRVNEMNKADGVLEVWVDGKKRLSRSDIEFRGQPQALIDSFYFSTFHGGNTPEWAPKQDTTAYFDNFIISTAPLIQ